MKLAEALIIRADLKRRIEQTRERMYDNIIIQEGSKSNENTEDLINIFLDLQEELKNIINKINKTNNTLKFDNNKTISDVIVEREMILSKRNFLANVVKRASEPQVRYSNTEIRNIPTVNVIKIQKQVDKLSKEYRELDIKLQAKNWEVDLVE